MSLMCDSEIRERCEGSALMITPFHGESIKVDEAGNKIASYGLSSGGYDFRAGTEFKLYNPPKKLSFWGRLRWLLFGRIPATQVLDYKKISEEDFTTVTGDKVVVPPGGFVLAYTPEYVKMPRDVFGLCTGKSTLARAGWSCLSTPIEPGWEGHITLEFQNTTNRPSVFYANEGCLQIMFFRIKPCDVSYADRGGKYNGQGKQITLPRV